MNKINVILNGFPDGIERKATMYKGRPLGDTPKTYKPVKTLGHNIGSSYNPSWLKLYKAKDGTLRYEIYRDGCLYQYFGKIEIEGYEVQS